MNEQENRDRTIVRTSLIGIAANLILAGSKAAVGILTHSIAILLDAVNNLSDVLSSVVTIIGTKLAGRKPDKKHPLGHGRIEYLSAMIVAAIVLYAGITAGVESVKKLYAPEETSYTWVSFGIIAAAVVVKILLGFFTRRTGEKVNSAALIASGSDASFDAVLSASTLACGLLAKFTGISLEAVVGILIAIVIIKAGFEMLLETVDEILGKRPDPELLKTIRQTICTDDDVRGAYDLILHSYGPDRYVGSVHVEVQDTMTADEIDAMERRIADLVLKEHNVLLAGIGIYSMNTTDNKVKELRSALTRLVMAEEGMLQMHGFHLDEAEKTVSFDVVIDYAREDREQLFASVCQKAQEAYPDYQFRITLDIDYL